MYSSNSQVCVIWGADQALAVAAPRTQDLDVVGRVPSSVQFSADDPSVVDIFPPPRACHTFSHELRIRIWMTKHYNS